jgi:dTDP-4-dehydrorhamnose reductase
MKWLITGASGQLGLALQEELTQRGIDFAGANSSELDITKPLNVNQMVDLIKPSVIINSAAWTDVDGAESNESTAYSVNALGPQNLANAASKAGARLVQISTDYVFSGDASSPWSEKAPHNPQSVYGSTKSEGEKFVLTTLPSNSYVVRTAWLYSHKGKNFAKTMTNLA